MKIGLIATATSAWLMQCATNWVHTGGAMLWFCDTGSGSQSSPNSNDFTGSLVNQTGNNWAGKSGTGKPSLSWSSHDSQHTALRPRQSM